MTFGRSQDYGAGHDDRAVRHTLRRADAAAARGDYEEALEWVSVLDSIGHEIPPEYERKRVEWLEALSAARER